MKPRRKSVKEKLMNAGLAAAFVETTTGVSRSDQVLIIDEASMVDGPNTVSRRTHEAAEYGEPAPKDARMVWGFRGILEKDESFSLVHNRQGARAAPDFTDGDRDKFKEWLDNVILPILQHQSKTMVHNSDSRYFHFKWTMPLGTVRAIISTHGRSGYMYGVVYLEKA